jgi:hypothetical protein
MLQFARVGETSAMNIGNLDDFVSFKAFRKIGEIYFYSSYLTVFPNVIPSMKRAESTPLIPNPTRLRNFLLSGKKFSEVLQSRSNNLRF